MPKIIKNGVTYIGTSDSASAVSYDNTSSGLVATNVQGAIDEVNGKGIGDIDDVNISSVAGGDALIYDSTSGKWVNTSLNSTTSPLFYVGTYTYTAASVAAGENINISRANFSITDVSGYQPLTVGRVGVSKAGFGITSFNASGVSSVLSVRNDTSAAIANTTFTVRIVFAKTNFLKDLA